MGNDRCRWVRHRLPLLAGGDLGPHERRRAERHLIGCPDCRALLESSGDALSALRSAAVGSPARPDAPSLWPALARQIRESRHAAPRPSFWDLIRPRIASGPWPALGLAMGLGAIVATLPRIREVPRAALPAAVEVVSSEPKHPLTPAAPTPRGALPDDSGRPVAAPSMAGADPFAPPTTRLSYDLDHGTPVGPGGRDPQHSY